VVVIALAMLYIFGPAAIARLRYRDAPSVVPA
jgi:hypothetical protein